MIDFSLEKLKRIPLEDQKTWEGGWFVLENLKVAEDPAPGGYAAGLWFCLQDGTLGPRGDTVQPADLASADKLFELMVRFAEDNPRGAHRPGTIRLTDPALAAGLQERLAGLDITIEVVTELERLPELAGVLADSLAAGPVEKDPLSMLAADHLSLEAIIRFGLAAARFYRAALWQRLSDLDLITITTPSPTPFMQHVCVLGAAGYEYGLGFFRDREDHDRMQSSGDPAHIGTEGKPTWIYSYNARNEKGFRHIFLDWEHMGLPLAGPEAFPLLLKHVPGQGGELPTAEELEFFTGLLLALAESSEKQMDAGRWSVAVPTPSGEVEYAFEMPYMLEPLNTADILRWGHMPDPRANLGLFDAMSNLLPEGGRPEDFQDKVDTLVGRTLEDVAAEADLPDTARQRARRLAFAGFESLGYRRQVLARQALREDPDCLHALLLLAEETTDPVRKVDICRHAIAAGRRDLPLQQWREEVGDLQGIPDARPFLNCLAMATDYLANEDLPGSRQDKAAEALDYGTQYLQLQPQDPASTRHNVLEILLENDALDEAEKLLAAWPDLDDDGSYLPEEDFMTGNGDQLLLPLAEILLELKKGADPASFARRLSEIHRRTNRYVLPLLMKGTRPPATALRSFALGGGVVAEVVARLLGPAWKATPATARLSYGPATGGKKSGKKKKKRR